MPYLYVIVFGLTLVGAVGVAFWRGGRDEKQVAIALIVAAVASPLMQNASFDNDQYGLVFVDGLLLLVLCLVALRSDRHWPMVAASFQLTTMLFHIARGSSAGVVAGAYADAIVFWGYLVAVALAVGTLVEAKGVRP